MGFEDILVKIGDFGTYQKLLCIFFVFYTTFLCGLNYYTQIFIFATPPHRCEQPRLDALQQKFSASWDDIRPWVPVEKGYSSKCSVVDVENHQELFFNHSQKYFNNLHLKEVDPDFFQGIRRDVLSFVDNVPHKSCDAGWSYDHDMVFNTIASDNDWVCQEDWKPFMIQTIFWVGNTVGGFVWGITNDYLGRKPTVLLSHSVYFLAGIATLFVPNFALLCACRFLVGSAHHTVSHLPYLLVIEYCGVDSRTVPLFMVMVSYSVASMTVPWLAMALPSWQALAAIGSCLILPILIGWK